MLGGIDGNRRHFERAYTRRAHGLVGQGSRAVIGLKKLNDSNSLRDPSSGDVFVASRLLVSLMIGFISGVVASIALGLDKLTNVDAGNLDVLLGIAAAGYAGTDAIEAFVARIAPASSSTSTPPTQGGETGAAPKNDPTPAVVPQTGSTPPSPTDPDLEASMAEMKSDLATIRSSIEEASATSVSLIAKVGDVFDDVTPELVKEMFVPETPLSNIKKHLPNVIAGLRLKGLVDRSMLLMALSTIRAESEGYVPISEFVSSFNTDKQPFDKYDKGTPIGKKLGNTQAGDGAKFRGRGFVQLTGRDNYQRVGRSTWHGSCRQPRAGQRLGIGRHYPGTVPAEQGDRDPRGAGRRRPQDGKAPRQRRLAWIHAVQRCLRKGRTAPSRDEDR